MALAEVVAEDLRSRIESKAGSPCKLTLPALARHYNVSLTPIRAAVKQLVDEGYLVTLSTGRIQLNDRPPKRRQSKKSRPVEPPKNYESMIQSELIRLSLMGDSRYVREAATADKFGIGRTVLRPILSRLAGRGLIEFIPRRGWRIRAFDKKDLCDFLVVREMLELKALDEARPKLADEVLSQLLEDNRTISTMQIGALNNNLHSYWVNLSDNRYIIEFFARQGLYYTTLFHYAAPEAHVVQQMAVQHCEILEALISKRWSEAKKALARHIRDQKPIVAQLMEQVQRRSVSSLG
jgi:DNA-binding GntR family transcriptional regulator